MNTYSYNLKFNKGFFAKEFPDDHISWTFYKFGGDPKKWYPTMSGIWIYRENSKENIDYLKLMLATHAI